MTSLVQTAGISLEQAWPALALTALAGLSTGIGALTAWVVNRKDTRWLALAMGLSAGVMIYVSFMELLPHAVDSLTSLMGHREGYGTALLLFFAGVGLIALIDKLVPEDENPHEMHTMDELTRPEGSHHRNMHRTGMMLMIVIGIHNFPEGMATFIAAMDGMDVALPIVIAIAIHNIPEGVAVSVPIYQATGNRRKAFWLAMLSGLSEPIGALLGMLILMPFWTPAMEAWCLAAVAGIMVYISMDELLPGAESYGHHHIAIAGVVAGMAIMALTLWMM